MSRGPTARLAAYFGLVPDDVSPDPRTRPPRASPRMRVAAMLVAAVIVAVLLDPTELTGDGIGGWLLRLAIVWTLAIGFSLVAGRIAARELRERRRWRDPPSAL